MPRKAHLEFQVVALMGARQVRHHDLAKAIGMTDEGLRERLSEPNTLTPEEIRRIERALQAPPGWRRMARRELPNGTIPLSKPATSEERELSDRLRKLSRPVAVRMLWTLRKMKRDEKARDRGEITEAEWKRRLGQDLVVIEEVQHALGFITSNARRAKQ